MHLIENCGLLSKLLPGNVILADHGFTIEQAAGVYCAEVIHQRQGVVNVASFHDFSNTILCPPLSADCGGVGRCTRVLPALGNY